MLEASPEDLQEINGIGPQNIFGIKLAQEITKEFLKEKIIKKEFCKSAKDVINYLHSTMNGLKKEVFKVIFLDSSNRILDIEDLFQGTIDKSEIYPREIVKSAIKHNASALIFVHNHPSGSSNPSLSDKKITKDLVSAGKLMDIKILDHIIIGDDTHYSFANQGEI